MARDVSVVIGQEDFRGPAGIDQSKGYPFQEMPEPVCSFLANRNPTMMLLEPGLFPPRSEDRNLLGL